MGVAEINGRPATAGDLAALAFAGYGHFTSLQVREHRVRGFDLHLVRLRENSRELFGWAVEDDRVRGYLRRALRAGPADASVQVNVFSGDGAAVESGRPVDPDVLVRAGPPATSGTTPVRVLTTRYQRLLPHIKHVRPTSSHLPSLADPCTKSLTFAGAPRWRHATAAPHRSAVAGGRAAR